MSPRYREVYIPAAHADEFEAYLQSMDGTFGWKKRAPDEFKDEKDKLKAIAPEWNRQASQARQLLTQFANENNDLQVVAGIRKGVVSLLTDAFHGDYPFPVDWRRAKKTLIEAFSSYLPENSPEGIVLRLDRKGNQLLQRLSTSPVRIVPRHIIFLMERYGLSDGQQKTIKEIAEKNELSQAAVRQYIERSFRAIRSIVLHK